MKGLYEIVEGVGFRKQLSDFTAGIIDFESRLELLRWQLERDPYEVGQWLSRESQNRIVIVETSLPSYSIIVRFKPDESSKTVTLIGVFPKSDL